jgi:protein-tyrosine phosphatase
VTNTSAEPAVLLANLREVGGSGFQAGRRRTVYRSNTRPVDPSAYPAEIAIVLDLRRDDEVGRVPHPLGVTAGYRRVPLFDPSVDLESADEAIHLNEQYIDWLERHRTTIPDAFRALAEVDGDALVCCSAGKDRTGVVSALLARLWGADLDRIGRDYALTAELLAEQFAEELAASEDRDFTLIQQALTPEVMIAVIEHVEARYESVQGYLTSIGLTEAEISAL